MKFYNILFHGWSLEKDPVTGHYVYGSVPRLLLDSYSLCKFYTKSVWKGSTKMITSRLSYAWNFMSKSHPRITLAITAAAATVGYFVGVGLAWSIAFKILKWINLF